MHDLSQILWICYVVCTKVNSSFERSNYTAFSLFALISGEPHTLLDLGSGGYLACEQALCLGSVWGKIARKGKGKGGREAFSLFALPTPLD